MLLLAWYWTRTSAGRNVVNSGTTLTPGWPGPFYPILLQRRPGGDKDQTARSQGKKREQGHRTNFGLTVLEILQPFSNSLFNSHVAVWEAGVASVALEAREFHCLGTRPASCVAEPRCLQRGTGSRPWPSQRGRSAGRWEARDFSRKSLRVGSANKVEIPNRSISLEQINGEDLVHERIRKV